MSQIDRYVIEREIGRGAMGVVYLAHDPRLNRRVAVKTCSLPEGLSEDLAKQFHERFLREARAAASLSHPGIVTVYDAGEDAARGLSYIAMEYVPGESLKQRLEKSRPLDTAWVVAFGTVLADALQTAHRAGIVHRDIKPANILIREPDGAVKIADFGVARLSSSDLTRSGASIGSPGYMSPEQVRGGDLDGRSDLFSLAVVLYEAFCGKRPFHGDDLVALAYSIAHDTQVPLARSMKGCPPGLDAFFEKALSKEPAGRFPDGSAFREALLKVGDPSASGRRDETVADGVTLAASPAADPARTVAAGARPARGPGRVRRVGAILSLALAAIGLVSAATYYVTMVRPAAARAERLAAAPRSAPARPAPPTPSRDAMPQDTAPTAPPGARAGPSSGPSASRDTTASQDGVGTGTAGRAPAREAAGTGGLADLAPAPVVPQIPRPARATVPAGTEMRVKLEAPVGSASSLVGDRFTARVAEPVVVGDRVVIPVGSAVGGRVSEATPAKKGLSDKGGSLALAFDELVTPRGTGAGLSASMTRAASGSGKKTAGIIGGSAAGGALLGKMLGGDSKKTAVGTVVGGAIGAGIAAGTKGEDVVLAAGSILTIRLDQPLTVPIGP